MHMILVIAANDETRVNGLRQLLHHLPNTPKAIQIINNPRDRLAGNVVNLVSKPGAGINIPNMVKDIIATSEKEGIDLIVSADYLSVEADRINFVNTVASGYDVCAVICDDSVIGITEGFQSVFTIDEFV